MRRSEFVAEGGHEPFEADVADQPELGERDVDGDPVGSGSGIEAVGERQLE
jgi:hypothetical protein